MPQRKKSTASSPKVHEQDRYVAALSYLWALCLVPLFLKRDNQFVRSHAKQGLVLFGAELVGTFLYWIPIFGWLLFFSFIAASAYGISIAMRGETWEIPVIGKYAHKLSL